MLVATPTLHHFYPDASTQIIQDFYGSTDLKTYLLTYAVSTSQASSLGAGLGTWAKDFHTWGAAPEQAELRATMQKNSTALGLKFRVNFGRLVATVDMFPAILERSRGLFKQIEAEMKKRVASQDTAKLGIIHGDFWSGKYDAAIWSFFCLLRISSSAKACRNQYPSPRCSSSQCSLSTTRPGKAFHHRLGTVPSRNPKSRPRPVLRRVIPPKPLPRHRCWRTHDRNLFDSVWEDGR